MRRDFDTALQQADATVHNETAAVIPVRSPRRSMSRPQTGLPIMYAKENAETM